MPFKPVGIDDNGKLPTRARGGIADDIADPASAIGSALSASYVGFGTVDPSTFLPPGTEYVWNQTDGAGVLLDIVSGVA